MPHRICHLIDANIDTNYFRSIALRHDKSNFPVTIGSLALGGALQQAMQALETNTFAIGTTARWRYPAVIAQLARLLRAEQIALLHAHCFDATFVGLLAARLARVPFVFTRHHSDHNIRLGKHWHTRIDSWCARNANHTIAVSEATRRIMMDVEGVPSEKITVVYNGMEVLRQPDQERVQQLRREFNLQDRPVCLMLARLHEEKGFTYLFRVLPAIIQECGSLTVLVAGDGPHRAELESEVRQIGLQDVVRFLGRRDDVPELLALASLVAVPSLAESFGFVCLEAMSVGVPVVATTTGGIPEVVEDGKTGLLVPTANPDALAVAMIRLLKDREYARTLGEAGRMRASQFTFERMIQGYESIYQQVLKDKKQRKAVSMMETHAG